LIVRYDGGAVEVFTPDSLLEHGHYFVNTFGSNQGIFRWITAKTMVGGDGVIGDTLSLAGGMFATTNSASFMIENPTARSSYENAPAAISVLLVIRY